ncbi:MAG: hypothetical protein K0B85_00495 [Coriobacteriia bacterium]|nr:hypothetical protein [Coriobacteriia bacterium]
MSIILAGALILVGLVGAALAIVAVPALFGAMAYDLVSSREVSVAKVADTRLRIATERNVARGFVIAGGLFWSVASFAGLYVFQESGLQYALMAAFIPLVAIAATLIIGWYFERVAAALLVLASMGVVAWGVIYQFEAGVWGIMAVFLIGPMLTAATLFWLARRDHDALELALSLQPEFSQVAVAQSGNN